MKLKHTNVISHVTNFIRLVVFLSIIAFLLAESFMTQQAVDNVKLSNSINDIHHTIASEMYEAYFLQSEYAAHPDTAILKLHIVTESALLHQIQLLQQVVRPENVASFKRLLLLQTQYIAASDQFFVAVNAKDNRQADALIADTINPLFSSITDELRQQTQQEAARLSNALTQLSTVQTITFWIGLLLFVVGTLLLSITVRVTRVYRKRIDEATRDEIERLEYLALTDPLTGLGNHYAYQEYLALAWQEAHNQQESLVMVICDIDDFKLLNDEQGHQRGDEILLTVVQELRTIHLPHKLFRLSADDFVMLLTGTTQVQVTDELEKIREAIQQRCSGTTISIGMTMFDSGDLTLETFEAQSVQALQEAKRQGRNRILIFETIANDASFIPLAKRQAVRRVISESLLTVAFQPIWNLATGRVAAFEALTRPAPESGFAGPQELFDVAEQIGRAHELDATCIRAILARAAELPAETLLFMNLTPQSLVHDLLSGSILHEMVIAAGLEPARVVIEITERSIVKLSEVMLRASYLQRLGFRIALDDAGAGNAGLEMLSHLAVDFIKIDREVVANAPTNQAARGVFAGITTIARESGIAIVAEGIETTEILNSVYQAGAQYAQGYLLGRPAKTISEVRMLEDVLPLLHAR